MEPQKTRTLWQEIVSGWHWAVFVWKSMGRIGGMIAITKAIGSTLALLARRTLVQWGIIKGTESLSNGDSQSSQQETSNSR
ncbi:MAG: hypothetical protein ACK456_12855 [Pseudanabaenaceae cyanobacterium]|jgi:hypothetical protein